MPHPRDFDAAAYDTLVTRPGEPVVIGSKRRGRKFVFREFEPSGARKIREEDCADKEANKQIQAAEKRRSRSRSRGKSKSPRRRHSHSNGTSQERKNGLKFFDGKQWRFGH